MPNTETPKLIHIRTIADIVADPDYATAHHSNTPVGVKTEIQNILGESATTILLQLDGQELSPDVGINLSEWNSWNDMCFAEELGANAGLNLFALSGSGDGWAIDQTTGLVVFLHHDLPDPRRDLGVSLPVFIQIADAWAQVWSHTADDPNLKDACLAAFIDAIAPLLPASYGDNPWPWPYF